VARRRTLAYPAARWSARSSARGAARRTAGAGTTLPTPTRHTPMAPSSVMRSHWRRRRALPGFVFGAAPTTTWGRTTRSMGSSASTAARCRYPRNWWRDTAARASPPRGRVHRDGATAHAVLDRFALRQRAREPTAAARCTTGCGSLLEQLLFCSTHNFSLFSADNVFCGCKSASCWRQSHGRVRIDVFFSIPESNRLIGGPGG
jgi:hypothetical protein